MQPEQSRKERFASYAAILRERFGSGVLSELQPLSQWVVWRGEVEGEKHKKVPYNPRHHLIRASVKIPKSGGTLTEALTHKDTGNYSRIGFVITLALVYISVA